MSTERLFFSQNLRLLFISNGVGGGVVIRSDAKTLRSNENSVVILLSSLTTPVVYDQVKTGSSELQADAEELNQSKSVGTWIVIILHNPSASASVPDNLVFTRS